jgi:glucosamine-6-phosphate deaminase
MKKKIKGMTIFICQDYEEMSKKAANIVAAQLIIKPKSVLGLATGSTPAGMYEQLVKLYNQDDLDFSEVTTFNLDEYYPIQKTNEQSYYYYMRTNLFNHINVNDHSINIPNGETTNIQKECYDYDDAIYLHGGIDLQVLGIGNNGHIGFNEPDVRFESGTHLVKLDEETIKANARFFGSQEEVPTKAISMGIRTIMHSKKIVLLASGQSKAHIIEQMLLGDITPNVPASILQLHNEVTLILDKDAASNIFEKYN